MIDCAAEFGYKTLFFPMAMTCPRERSCIEGVIERCRNKEMCSIVEGFPDAPEHINKVANCKCFIGHKTHSVIFALTTGTPVVAIAYQRKTQDFMNQFGLGEYCISDTELTAEKLIYLFKKVTTNYK